MGRHVERDPGRAQRGAGVVEHVALLALITVGMTVALAVVTRRLVAVHDAIQRLCGLPFP